MCLSTASVELEGSSMKQLAGRDTSSMVLWDIGHLQLAGTLDNMAEHILVAACQEAPGASQMTEDC